jgi:hypothetical protein
VLEPEHDSGKGCNGYVDRGPRTVADAGKAIWRDADDRERRVLDLNCLAKSRDVSSVVCLPETV